MSDPSSPKELMRAIISRRRFLAGAGAAFGGMALSSCTSVGAGVTGGELDEQTVAYWNLFGGGDGVRMQEMQEVFRQENPDLDLSAVTLAWGPPYYTKLSLATLGDKPPDVAVSHLTRMKTLVDADLLEELTPDVLAEWNLQPENFTATTWDEGLVDGKAYAIPLDTHPFVLFYNTDLCEAAGLLQDGVLAPLEGEDAFLDALDRAKSAGAANALVCSVTADPATNWRNFQSLYSQLGGEVLADNGSRVVLDDEKATQALEYLRGLVDQELLAPDLDYGGSIALFSSGESAFYVQGEWEISTFLTAETPFSMTLYPNVFGGSNYTVQADSHVLVLPRQPDGGGAMRWERSGRFITSMLEQSLTWAMGGHVPSYLPVRDSAEYQELSPQSAYAEAADAAVYDPPGWYSGSGSDFETAMGESVAGVINGQLSVDQSLNQMHDKLDVLAETRPPV